MTRRWLSLLYRKLLLGLPLRKIPRPARRMLAVGLLLESLEDRAVPSTLNVQPAVLPALQGTGIPNASYQEFATTPGPLSPNSSAAMFAAGLDRLAEAISTNDFTLSPDHLTVGEQVGFSTDQTRSSQTVDSSVPPTSGETHPGAPQTLAPGSSSFVPTAPATDTGKPGATTSPPAAPPAARTDRMGAPAQSDTNTIELTSLAQPESSETVQPQTSPAAIPALNRSGTSPSAADQWIEDRDSPSSNGTATARGDLSNGAHAEETPAQRVDQHPAGSFERFASDDARSASSPARELELPANLVKPFTGARAPVDRFLARLSDGALLRRFVVYREEAAFTALVQRYDRLVYGVCQNVLGDSHSAQDAFQGTFLTLARKANVLAWQNPLGGWLARVAYRLALRLREVAARRRRSEQQAAGERPFQVAGESSAELEKQELRQALSEELERLPEKYRAPLVLCYLHGRTHDEASRLIGLPRGSMAKRIGEGLERLRERLQGRGFRF